MILLVGLLGFWSFLAIADEVREGGTRAIDNWLFWVFRHPGDPALPVGPAWFNSAMRDITALGGWALLSLWTFVTAGYLYLQRRYRLMGLVLGAMGGGALLSEILKAVFARERPPGADLLVKESFGFPSGHSMMAALVYPTLAILLARIMPSLKIRFYLLSVGVLLMFLIGFSRIYLGLHYATDVLAGWSAGLAWASLIWFIAWYLQRKGKMDSG
jgi:undecaprenyl-diphosphatase